MTLRVGKVITRVFITSIAGDSTERRTLLLPLGGTRPRRLVDVINGPARGYMHIRTSLHKFQIGDGRFNFQLVSGVHCIIIH